MNVEQVRASKIRQFQEAATDLERHTDVVERIRRYMETSSDAALIQIADNVIAPLLTAYPTVNPYDVARQICLVDAAGEGIPLLSGDIRRQIQENCMRRRQQMLAERSPIWTSAARDRLMELCASEGFYHDGSNQRYVSYTPHFGRIARQLNDEFGTDLFTHRKCGNMYHALAANMMMDDDIAPDVLREKQEMDAAGVPRRVA